MKREIPKYKKEKVKELTKLIDSSDVVALVEMSKLPASQLQHIREKLRGRADILMSKKSLMNLALEASSKKGIKEMTKFLDVMPAFLITTMDPFELSVTIDKEKVPSAPRKGDIAPEDIVVKAGPTPFAPGPIIAELSELGLKTKVDAGKLAVIRDTVVAKEGDEINDKLAAILKRLEIKPMKVGLKLVAVCEKGDIYSGDVLTVSQEEYMEKISLAYRSAFNIAFNMKFVTEETVVPLLSQGKTEAWNLSVNLAILSPETRDIVLSLANSRMMILAHIINEKEPKALSEEFSKMLAEIGIKEVFGGE